MTTENINQAIEVQLIIACSDGHVEVTPEKVESVKRIISTIRKECDENWRRKIEGADIECCPKYPMGGGRCNQKDCRSCMADDTFKLGHAAALQSLLDNKK